MPTKRGTPSSTTSSTSTTHYEHSIADIVIQLHNLARQIHPAPHAVNIRILADELAVIGKEYHEYVDSHKLYDSSKFVIGL